MKPILKCKKKTLIKVEYGDLEDYIRGITGKSIEIPMILECGNDSDHEITVGGPYRVTSESEKKKMDDFLFGTAKDIPTYHLPNLLDVMCGHGLLEAGDYLISVSW